MNRPKTLRNSPLLKVSYLDFGQRSHPFVEEPEENEGETKDVKPWLKQDPSRRFRHRFHHSKDDKGPCKEAEKALLKDLEEADQKEFFAIKTDDNLSLNQKKEKYTQWADKANKEVRNCLEGVERRFRARWRSSSRSRPSGRRPRRMNWRR